MAHSSPSFTFTRKTLEHTPTRVAHRDEIAPGGRVATEAGERLKLVTRLAKRCEIQDLVDAFNDPTTKFRQAMDKLGITADMLYETILTKRVPPAVKKAFQLHFNKGRGEMAAIGAMILRAEAAAASELAKELKDTDKKAAAAFAETAKKDLRYVDQFERRAKGAYVGVNDLRSI